MKAQPVKMIHAALDENESKDIILRGLVVADTLTNLQVDTYQREAMPLTSLSSILSAIEGRQALPDIELAMRGGRFEETKDGLFIMRDPIYIVDGQQRVNGGIHILNTKPDIPVRIGATLHFNTTRAWERERFRILNSLQQKVSPNVLLRNMAEDSRAVQMLYSLTTTDKNFVLSDRISWKQRMMRTEMISALTIAKICGILHTHKVRGIRTSIAELVPILDKSVDIVGIQNLRRNVVAFFDLIDECWGIRRVQYREGAAYMRGPFLFMLARLLSDHHDFWKQPDEKQLFIEAPLRRKIAGFPITDPQVNTLAGAGGKSREYLYMLLRDHINSGRRTKRLTSRLGDLVDFSEDDDEVTTTANEARLLQ